MSDIDTILREIKPRVISWIHQDVGTAISAVSNNDHGKLLGLLDDDHTQYMHINVARSITAKHTFAPTSPDVPFILSANAQGQLISGLYADQVDKSVIAGSGLTGGGVLNADRTLNVGAGTLISVAADSVSLSNGTAQYQLPLTGASPFTPFWTSASSNPGAAVAVLRTDTSGYLSLLRINVDSIVDRSGGNLTLAPTGDITLDPAGNDVLPFTNYDLNLGAISKKYLTLHAAELWVETLVAQNTIATIGGRILVAPTTELTSDFPGTQEELMLNAGFETLGTPTFQSWDEYNENGGDTTADTVSPHAGTYSAKIYNGTAGFTRVNQAITVVPNAGYTLSFWAKGDGTNAGTYYVYDVTHAAYIIARTTTGITAATWTKIETYFKAPAGCTSITVGFAGHATVFTVYCNIDDVSLVSDYLYTKHNQMVELDIFYMASAPGGAAQVEFMRVIAGPFGTGPYGYSVQRNLDGTGINNWYAGDALLNTGQAGDGFIDIYSLRSMRSATHIGPTIVGNVRGNTGAFNDLIEYWAIGNLNGLYGYGTDTYGVAFGKFVAGNQVVAITETDGIWMGKYVGSGVWTERLSITPTGVLTISDSAGVAVIKLDASNGAEITKFLDMKGTASAIRIGTTVPTSPTAGTGIYIDRTGLYGVLSNVQQAYLSASTGALMAGAGNVRLDEHGVKFTVHGNYWPYPPDNGSQIYWDDSNSTRVATITAQSFVSGGRKDYLDLVKTCDTAYYEKAVRLTTTNSAATSYASLKIYDSSYPSRSVGMSLSIRVDSTDYYGFGVNQNGIYFSGAHYYGDLAANRNDTEYTGYIFVPLTTPITSTNWTNVSKSTTSKTLMDRSVDWSGVPVGCKALLIKVSLRDSGSSGADCFLVLSPNNTSGSGPVIRCSGLPNDYWTNATIIVPTDGGAEGDYYWQTVASGTTTLEITLQVWGYWI